MTEASVPSQQSRRSVRDAGVKRISLRSEPKAFDGNIKKELAALPKHSRKIEMNGRNNLNETRTRCRKEIISKRDEILKLENLKIERKLALENQKIVKFNTCYSVSNLP